MDCRANEKENGEMNMKKITEMEYEEIAELDDTTLDVMVKIECAEQGIPLEPTIPDQEFFDIPKDVQGHHVAIENLWFKNKENAVLLMNFINEKREDIFSKHYDWRTGYDLEWLTRVETLPNIETKLFTRKEFVTEKEELLVKRKTMKDDYESQKKKYESSREKKRKIADQVYGFYYEAKRRKSDVEKYKKIFNEYLSLANNNQEVAQGFFDKAYKEGLEESVYNKIMGTV